MDETRDICVMHTSCACTERAALVKRVFVDQPAMSSRAEASASKYTNWISKQFGRRNVKSLSLAEAVKSFGPSRRARYQRAYDNIQARGVNSKDSRIDFFVKADKCTDTSGEVKKPRAIQGRKPEFNLALARYIKPFEKVAKSYKGMKRGVPKTRVFAKGMTNNERAKIIVEKISHFQKPKVLSLDASSFDSCVSTLWLKLVDKIYLATFQGDIELAELLKMRHKNSGRTPSGIKYTIKGNRMSGDMDTGIGNSFVTYILVHAAMNLLGVKKWDCYCDGDDLLIFLEAESTSLKEFVDIGLELGFNYTGEEIYVTNENYYDIEFCRSKPVWTPEGYTMCRIPSRAVQNFGVNHKFASWPMHAYLKFLKGCALCEMHVSYNLPVVGRLADLVYKSLSHKTAKFDVDDTYKSGLRLDIDKLSYRTWKVDERTRLEVELAWGMSIDEQYQLEDRFHEYVTGLFKRERTLKVSYIDGSDPVWRQHWNKHPTI